jgi:glycosyltransferase involved in cell wall biosynthesis
MNSERRAVLSICIPTYNRATYLQQCLAAVLPQAEAACVPVIVSDNASTDSTSEIIEAYAKNFSCLIYVRQPMNLGHDLNHKEIIKLAPSNFAWLLGDDDVVADGAIEILLGFLNSRNSCELILLNAWLTDNELRPGQLQFGISSNIFIDNCNDLLRSYSDKLTFGMMVVAVEKFNYVNGDRFLGTAHFYGGVVYDYLALSYKRCGRNEIAIISTPLVRLRQGERKWNRNICDINIRCVPEFFNKLDPLYCVNANKSLLAATRSLRLTHTGLQFRAGGWLDWAYVQNISHYYSGWQRVALSTISLMPTGGAKALCVLWHFGSRCWHPLKRVIFSIRQK